MAETDRDLLHKFAQYASQHTAGFIGREWVFARLEHWLTDPDAPRFFVIRGAPGCGKTAIAARIYQFSSGTLPADAAYPSLRQGLLSAAYFCYAQNYSWINPTTFAESLASQLAPQYPPASLLNQSDSTMQVNATAHVQHAAPGSRVIGVLIERLFVTATSAVDAFLRFVRKPLEALCTPQFERQIIILIDGLDQAGAHSPAPTILDLLGDLQAFPKQIRFIVTTCPVDGILKSFQRAGAEICDLSAGDDVGHSDDDLQRAIQHWLDQPDNSSKLAADLSHRQFITIVKAKSGTNFLYVRHLLHMLTAHGQRITENVLTSFPDELDLLYRDSLERVIRPHKPKWESTDAHVLGTLAVAREALTTDHLAALTGLRSSALGHSLARMRPFLSVTKDRSTDEPHYTLYHSAFAEFLLNKDRADMFYCDPQEYHARICQYYADWWQTSQPLVANGFDLEQINRHDGYPFRHLSLHLYCARQHEPLIRLIKDRRWYAAQCAYDLSQASYLNDVQHGWLAVEYANKQAQRRARRIHRLSDEIVCALVIATYHSRADNVPPQLIIRLLESYTGQFEGVLAAVRHIRDRGVFANVLAALAQYLPPLAQPAVLQEAVALALTLEHGQVQADTLITIAPMLPADLMKEVIAVVHQMNDPAIQVAVLQELLPRIAEGGSAEEALAQVQQVAPELRLPLLARIAPVLRQPQLDAALALVQTTASADRAQRTQALGALFKQLVALGEAPAALERAQQLADAAERAAVFAQLLPALAEGGMVKEALAAAQTIVDSAQWSLVVAALLPIVASHDAAQQALDRASALTDTQQRVLAMAAIAPALPESLRPRALKEIRALDWRQPHSLIALAPILPESWLDEAIQVAARLAIPAERSTALIALLARLAELGKVSEAYQLAQIQLPPSERVRAYTRLLPALLAVVDPRVILAAISTSASDSDQIRLVQSLLPDLTAPEHFAELLSVVAAIESPQQRMQLLGMSAEYLPPAFIEQALEQTRMIGDRLAHPVSREMFLVRLAESGQADLALKVARTLEDRQERAQVLCALLRFIPEAEHAALVDAALAAITGPPEQRLQDLQRLVTKLPVAFRPLVAQAAWSIVPQLEASYPTIEAFIVWLPFAPVEQQPARVAEAWAIAATLADPQQQVLALVGLAPFLDPAQRREVLSMIWNLRDEAAQAQALTALAADLPEPLLREALSMAWLFRDTGAREAALVPLLTALGNTSHIDEALAAIVQLEPGPGRAEGLISLAHSFSAPQLRDALRAAWEIRDRRSKHRSVARLLFHLAKSGYQDEACAAVWMIEDDQGKAEALTQMTPELNHPWLDQARQMIESLEHSQQREQALVYLAGRMAELAETDAALEIVNMLEQPQQMAEAVARVAKHMPSLTPAIVRKAFEAASMIEDTSQRTAIFAELATPLMQLPPRQLYEVWRSTLRCSSQRSRAELHADLCALAPIIATLGGANTVPETINALAEIGQWWP